jgi:hypothetical protein
MILKKVPNDKDEHGYTLLKFYLTRIRGVTFLEAVTAESKHNMFLEDNILKEMWVGGWVCSRACVGACACVGAWVRGCVGAWVRDKAMCGWVCSRVCASLSAAAPMGFNITPLNIVWI